MEAYRGFESHRFRQHAPHQSQRVGRSCKGAKHRVLARKAVRQALVCGVWGSFLRRFPSRSLGQCQSKVLEGFPPSLRHVEDLLHERGIDISCEAVRFWWHRFGPLLASEIRKRHVVGMQTNGWRWHLDEVFKRTNGERHYLCRPVDHEGEVLESFVTKKRDKKARLKFQKKTQQRPGQANEIVTDRLRSYGAALNELGMRDLQETGRWANMRTVRTSCSEGESGPYSVSGGFDHRRSLDLSTPWSTTISTRNAPSTADRISRPTAPPLSQSGAAFLQPNRLLLQENWDWFVSV